MSFGYVIYFYNETVEHMTQECYLKFLNIFQDRPSTGEYCTNLFVN